MYAFVFVSASDSNSWLVYVHYVLPWPPAECMGDLTSPEPTLDSHDLFDEDECMCVQS